MILKKLLLGSLFFFNYLILFSQSNNNSPSLWDNIRNEKPIPLVFINGIEKDSVAIKKVKIDDIEQIESIIDKNVIQTKYKKKKIDKILIVKVKSNHK